ncbi:helix-turn-helix domain-containing protein [Burkholderia cenocepacia]|uniref:helix-turn-helix domain-containing protein n=1 Tax=Burkholderia cenocepacia TaxID=95486 RepID=UPI003D809A2A
METIESASSEYGVTPRKALTLKEAAALLGVSYATVYAHKVDMGFFRIGRQWRIWPEKLKTTTEYNSCRPARTEPKEKKCHSVSATARTSGTLTSARQVASELDNLLARPTKRRLRSITTG